MAGRVFLGALLVLACVAPGCWRFGYDAVSRDGGNAGATADAGNDASAQDAGHTGAGGGGTNGSAGAGGKAPRSGGQGAAGDGEAGSGGGGGSGGAEDGGAGGEVADAGTSQTPQEQCLALPFSGLDTCKQCRCEMCTQVVLSCSGIGAGADANCAPIVACARRVGCTSELCTCGSSPQCASPNGDCAQELITAADEANTTPAECNTEPTCAGYQALAVGQCVSDHCSGPCF